MSRAGSSACSPCVRPLLLALLHVIQIIQFSNMVSYDGRIKPLRDASRVRLRPHTVAQYLRGIPNSDLYDGQISIYHAPERIGGPCLRHGFVPS